MTVYMYHGKSYIYFAAPIGGGPIKIGCSVQPCERLKSLMEWSPYPLEIVAAVKGSLDDERAIHAAFCENWSHKEWFKPSEPLLALIDEICRTGALPAAYRASKLAAAE